MFIFIHGEFGVLYLTVGCSAKLPFCKSNPCQNGGTCRVGWETFFCDCPLGYGGKDCSHGERLYLNLVNTRAFSSPSSGSVFLKTAEGGSDLLPFVW